MYDAIIIGGGLAGLTTSIELAKRGHKVMVVEKKVYPFNRVCGEYVSNEVRPYLEKLGLNLDNLGAKKITKFQLTSVSGKVLNSPLKMGGFGISRYTLDYELFKIAESLGVEFLLNTSVEEVSSMKDYFYVEIQNHHSFSTKIVIGAYGKRTKLDKILKREFIQKSSPYLGIKYHIKYDFPKDLIALHNFVGGYCGISAIEDDKYCLCYLSERESLKKRSGIAQMEEEVLWKNPHLKRIFNEAEFIWSKPEVINEISFEKKSLIENNILMVGDSSSLITPLCGNGMAMAIHGGILVSNLVSKFLNQQISREELEILYQLEWNKQFSLRLKAGRTIQNLFGSKAISELTVGFFKIFKPFVPNIIQLTHGKQI
jgi:menaquinone-9 beta-reductase